MKHIYKLKLKIQIQYKIYQQEFNKTVKKTKKQKKQIIVLI